MRALLLIGLAACNSSKPTGAPCDTPGGRVCVGEDVVECAADGTLGAHVQHCKGVCRSGTCPDSCGLRDIELIYTVDRDNKLASFDPSKPVDQAFHAIGKLTCDPTSHPFSMSIDHDGIAWVQYRTGNVYRVSIIDGHCSAAPALAVRKLGGMSFVADAPSARTETLFVMENDPPHALLWIDTGALKIHTAAPKLELEVRQGPELTGTGDGAMYGYFPEHGRGFIQQINSHGHVVGTPIAVDTPQGQVSAWTFAHWGGTFYVFVTIDNHSNLYAVPRKGGPTQLIRENLPTAITGAGVSTCAPLLEKSS